MNMLTRFKLIMKRQGQFTWDKEYIPAIFANRVEGPKCSRLTQLVSLKQGRVLHLLSRAERALALLALYHPQLFDLHEQRVLSAISAPHPLEGHLRSVGMHLPHVLGTVEIAIKYGARHPKVYLSGKDEQYYAAFPYIGDLLLYMFSENGLPYCVNWTIKSETGDFTEKRRTKMKSPEQKKKDREKALYRQKLEEEHYAAAGIRTIQLTPHDIDEDVRYNLDGLFHWLSVDCQIDELVISEFDEEVSYCVANTLPLHNIVNSYSSLLGRREEFLARIYQNIWYRKLPVCLFSPILIDKPLSVANLDVLEVYSHLFSEKAL